MTAAEQKPTGPAALILAGGRGSRMGGTVAKPLVTLAGKPLVAHVASAIENFCAPLLLGTADGVAYGFLGLEAVADRRTGFQGPLAGVEAGLEYLQARAASPDRLLVVPGDTPFLRAADLAELALSGPPTSAIRVARWHGRLQPTVAIWPVSSLAALSRWLDAGRPRAVRTFLEDVGYDAVDFADVPGLPEGNPFFNVNTPKDLALAAACNAGR